MLPVMGITEAYVLLLLCLYLGVSLTENASPIYNYLDNELYSMPVLPRQGSQLGLGGYDPRFPPPPLFPPPPPSWESDTNKLLREVIFNNILEKIKKGIKGELQEEEDNSIEKDPNEEVKHKGSTLLPTDIPGCGDFPPPENSSKPGNPSTSSLVQGLPGPVGPKGEPGTQGRRGRRGREGPIGPEGRAGSPGIRGPPGLPGPAGVSGLADGQTGIRGPEGPRGPRGRTGFPGSIGPPGKPGPRGEDGIPGLVIFQNAAAMYGVQLEGLIAYRADTKQIYFRDHVTWRAIRVTRCGDGIVDHDLGEECDDANDNPTDSCVGCRRSFCGDGFLHIGQEECDGRNFGGRSCASWRPGMLGILQCNHRCLISYSRCRFPRRFAENEIDKTILPRG